MTKRQRINPHTQGTPEYTLFAAWRRASLEAAKHQQHADWHNTEAGAHRAKAAHYAQALDALGHPPDGATLLIEGPKA